MAAPHASQCHRCLWTTLPINNPDFSTPATHPTEGLIRADTPPSPICQEQAVSSCNRPPKKVPFGHPDPIWSSHILTLQRSVPPREALPPTKSMLCDFTSLAKSKAYRLVFIINNRSIYPSINLCIHHYPSVYQSIYQSLYPSISSIWIYLSITLSIILSI